MNVTVDKIETGDKKDPGFHFTIRAKTEVAELKTVGKQTETEKVNLLDRTQGL